MNSPFWFFLALAALAWIAWQEFNRRFVITRRPLRGAITLIGYRNRTRRRTDG